MRPTKRFGRDEDGEKPTSGQPRSFGKSRYTTAPPMRKGDGRSDSDAIEVSVDDVTVVVEKEEEHSWSKYDARPTLGYGETPASTPPVPDPEARVAATVVQPDDDDPIPEWGPWRSTVSEEGSRYTRSETRE